MTNFNQSVFGTARQAEAEAVHARSMEFIEKGSDQSVELGQAAIKSSMLINGGAAISVLALVGHFVEDEKIHRITFVIYLLLLCILVVELLVVRSLVAFHT